MQPNHTITFELLLLRSPETGERLEIAAPPTINADGSYSIIVASENGEQWQHTIKTVELTPAKEPVLTAYEAALRELHHAIAPHLNALPKDVEDVFNRSRITLHSHRYYGDTGFEEPQDEVPV